MRFITENLRVKDYNGALKVQHYLPMSNPEMFSEQTKQIVATAALTPDVAQKALADVRPIPAMNVVKEMNNQEQQEQAEQLEMIAAARGLIEDVHEYKFPA